MVDVPTDVFGLSLRPAPDVPVPQAKNPSVRRVVDAALAQEPGVPIEVGDLSTKDVAYQAVINANRNARRKVLRSYRHEGRMYVVRLADEAG